MALSKEAIQAIEGILTQCGTVDGPGAALIAVRNEEIVYRGAVGMANLEHGIQLDAGMVFRIGSLSKQFTAIAILMLMERGELALDDTIARFLPDWPAAGRDITLLQLLQHSSGLANYTALPQFAKISRLDAAPEVTMALYRDAPLDFEPGTRFAYSNSGYHLLGIIVATVSGLSYGEALRLWVFEPLQMAHTALEQPGQLVRQRVAGYSKSDGQWINAGFNSMTHPYAAGGLISTVDDLARWNAALQAGILVNPATLRQAFARGVLRDGSTIGYGLGWKLGECQGLSTIEHGGAIGGFLAYAISIPAEGLYLALLCNRDDGLNGEWIALQLCAQLLGLSWPATSVLDLHADTLLPYVGFYQGEGQVQRRVTLENGGLFCQRINGRRAQLLPLAEHVFCDSEFPFLHFVFGCDEAGNALSLALHTRFALDSGQRTADMELAP